MNIDESYRELGLAPTATDAEVKEAWRRLAAQWHPDRNASPQALRKIQRINSALAEIRRVKGMGPATGPAPFTAQEAAPEVVEHRVTLTLEEACTGCTRELHGQVEERCTDCAGAGLHARASTCTDCAGTGRVRPHLWFSWMTTTSECGACQGKGSRRARCAACAGNGYVRPRKYRCRVQVPAGTRAGAVLEVTAHVQGRQRQHELTLRVRVDWSPHPFFVMDASGTVACEVPVDGFAWMAERWTEVPTPRGMQQMRLRRDHLTYRIKGQGLPGDDGQSADCMVTVVPLFPEELGREQQALLDKLVAANSGARGSAAGKRIAAWQAAMQAWQAKGD